MRWNIVSEDDSTGNLLTTYVYSPVTRYTLAHVEGSSPVTSDFEYHWNDGRGTTRGLFSEAGERTYQLYYSPFGNTLHTTAQLNTRSPFGGKFYDKQIGQSQFPFRQYSADQNRWTKKDPLGFVDGTNLYAYVSNSPVTLMDYLGLSQGPFPPAQNPDGTYPGQFDPGGLPCKLSCWAMITYLRFELSLGCGINRAACDLLPTKKERDACRDFIDGGCDLGQDLLDDILDGCYCACDNTGISNIPPDYENPYEVDGYYIPPLY